MLLDALTTLSSYASLTGIAAGATGYSDVLDLSQSRDLAGDVGDPVPFSVCWTTLPTSATGGATVNIALQTSADNATWSTLMETAAQPITNPTAQDQWAWRGALPVGGLRYYRFAYTPSAVLTAGAVEAQIGADWTRSKSYPKNYFS